MCDRYHPTERYRLTVPGQHMGLIGSFKNADSSHEQQQRIHPTPTRLEEREKRDPRALQKLRLKLREKTGWSHPLPTPTCLPDTKNTQGRITLDIKPEINSGQTCQGSTKIKDGTYFNTRGRTAVAIAGSKNDIRVYLSGPPDS